MDWTAGQLQDCADNEEHRVARVGLLQNHRAGRPLCHPAGARSRLPQAARQQDPLERRSSGFKDEAAMPEVTMQQLAIVLFKIKNRLDDPLIDGPNKGCCHWPGIKDMLVKLEERAATMPNTKIPIVSPTAE